MNKWQRGGALMLILAVGAALIALRRTDEANASKTPVSTLPATTPTPSALPGAAALEDTTDNSTAAPQVPRYEHPVRDAQRATLVREMLVAQKSQQLNQPSSDARLMPQPQGTGNQADKPLGAYVNRIMQQQFLPLATQCYENLLAVRPSIAGNVELGFSILGDPSVGGVVVDASLGQGTTLTDPEFRTCLTESMFAVVFDAPPGDEGSVSVVQHFELSP